MERKRTSDDVIKLLNKLYYQKSRSVGDVVALRDQKQVKLPLAGLDVKADVVGRIADVTITQKYRNTFSENLEATYTFPLTASCSVYSVEMQFESRRVKGEIKERGQARLDYQQAIDEGKRACLMEQERDEIFTMNVGNIEPDEEVTIEIRYCETLTYFEDGSTEIRVPLVVAPKYIPGESVAREQVGSGVTNDTDRIPDASRISPPRLVDGFDPETDLNIAVSIVSQVSKLDHTASLKNLACSQHATRTNIGDGIVEVSLENKNELLNRDFVLRWTLATENIESAFVSFKARKSKYQFGLVSLMPPKMNPETNQGRDVVFLLDRSGSMQGEKMVSAKRACKYLLSSLGPNDRFAINAFDHQTDWMEVSHFQEDTDKFIRATEEGINAGQHFLTGIEAQGGTEIGQALRLAFDQLRYLPDKKEPVIVLITDGHIGFESNVLQMVQNKKVGARIFTVGIDSAVNYGFLERISQLSGATSSFVTPGCELESFMRRIANSIGEPLIQELEIEGVNCVIDPATVTPLIMPDLFAGRTAEIYFQFKKEGKEKPIVRIKGKLKDGGDFCEQLKVARRGLEAVSRLWAKRVISDLEDRYRNSYENQQEIHRAIVDLSIEYSVLSRLTAFTAIDEQKIDTVDQGLRQAVQPVHTPQAWGQSSVPGGRVYGSSSSNMVFMHKTKGNPGQNSLNQSGSWGGSASLSQNSTDSAWGSPSGQPHPAQSGPASPADTGAGMAPVPQARQPDSSRVAGSGKFLSHIQGPPLSGSNPEPQSAQEDSSSARSSKYFNLSDQEIDSLFGYGVSDDNSDSSKTGDSRGDHKSGSLSHDTEFVEGVIKVDPRLREAITAPLKRVLNALNTFFDCWKIAWEQLESDQMPDLVNLEECYQELVDSLDDHPVSFQLPKLSSFLHSNYFNFVSALKAPNRTIPALKAMRKQLNLGYDGVLNETQKVLTGALGKKGAFWQFTV